jgi:hypothetical protein
MAAIELIIGWVDGSLTNATREWIDEYARAGTRSGIRDAAERLGACSIPRDSWARRRGARPLPESRGVPALGGNERNPRMPPTLPRAVARRRQKSPASRSSGTIRSSSRTVNATASTRHARNPGTRRHPHEEDTRAGEDARIWHRCRRDPRLLPVARCLYSLDTSAMRCVTTARGTSRSGRSGDGVRGAVLYSRKGLVVAPALGSLRYSHEADVGLSRHRDLDDHAALAVMALRMTKCWASCSTICTQVDRRPVT